MKVRTLRWAMVAMLVASCMVVGTGTAFGQTPVALTNADFETDTVVLTQGFRNFYTANEFGAAWYTNQVEPTGWTFVNSPTTYPHYTGTVDIGALNATYGSYPDAVGGGTNAATFYNAYFTYTSYDGLGMLQTSADLIVDGQTYTLTADGNSWDFAAGSELRVELYYTDVAADDTVPANRTTIVENTFSLDLIASGPWAPLSLEFNSGAVPGAIGKEIGVLLEAPSRLGPAPNGDPVGPDDHGYYPLIDNIAISYLTTVIVVDTAITASSPFAIEGVDFQLTAPGVGPYGWTLDGAPVGGNTPTLDFLPLAAGDGGTYRVTFDDGSKAPNTSDPYFVELLASGTTLPVAGLLGLGLLASACAMGGATVLRRKK